jgi:hypothetical protein
MRESSSMTKIFKIVSFIILVILIAITITIIKLYQEMNGGIIVSLTIASILQIIFFRLVLIQLIEMSIDSKDKKRICMSFGINLLFSTPAIALVFEYKYFDYIIYQLFSLVVLIIIICLVNEGINTKIKKGSDLSTLKATNIFLISIYTGIIFFLGKFDCTKVVEQYINFYYVLPMLIVQGFYELLDGKSK